MNSEQSWNVRAVRVLGPALLVTLLIGLPGLGLAINVGDTAPPFALLDLDGRVQSLESLAGHVAVLYFIGHNAEVCREPARLLQHQLLPAYQERGLRILGIDCWDGSAEQLGQFRQETGVEFPLLMAGHSTAQVYDLAYNSFVVIDGKGKIRYISPGPEETAFDLSALDGAVRDSMEDPAAVNNATWGAIKSLYGNRRRWERIPL